MEEVKIALSHLHCFDEGDGAGDSVPYLWTLFFKIDANTLERGEVTERPGNQGDLHVSGVSAGDTVRIPPDLGEFATTVTPIFTLPAIVGCLVLLLEEDNTPNSAIAAGHRRLNAVFRDELAKVITEKTQQLLGGGGGSLAEFLTDAEIDDLKTRIGAQVSQAIEAEVSAWDWISGLGDMDDLIGAHLFVFTTKQIKDGGNARGFSRRFTPDGGSEDGDYEIRGVVTLAPVIPESAQGALAHQETPSAAMYLHDGTERMYVFYRATDGSLRVNIWSGATWAWDYRGTPQQGQLKGSPSAVRAFQPGGARLYAFVAGADGRLYVNTWNRSEWRWAEQGAPPGTLMAGSPSALAYWRESYGETSEVSQRMQVFCVGQNGRLYSNEWNGAQWQWLQHQKPAAALTGRPAVATMSVSGRQRVYAFVRDAAGGLAERYWDGLDWHWTPHGAPSGTTVASDACMVAAPIGGADRLYVFFVTANGRLCVRFWDGAAWKWGDLESPSAVVIGRPTATAYRLGSQTRINVFVRCTDGQLRETYWDGSRWQWSIRGDPGVKLAGTPDVVTWHAGRVLRLNVFAPGENGHAYSDWWNGSEWNWAHQGTPA